MSGAIPVVRDASLSNRQPTERSGSRSAMQWRRAAIGDVTTTPPAAILAALSSSTSAAVSLSSGELSTTSLGLSSTPAQLPSAISSPDSASPTFAITHAANLPTSLPVSGSETIVPIYGTVPDTSPTDADSSVDASVSSTSKSSAATISPIAHIPASITHAATLPASLSVSASRSIVRTVPDTSPTDADTSVNASVSSTSESSAATISPIAHVPVFNGSPSSLGSSSAANTATTATASTSTTFSLKLFPPGFPTPASKKSSVSLLPDSTSSGSPANNTSTSPESSRTRTTSPVLPTGLISPGATLTSRGSTIRDPSATISFSVVLDSATQPGNSAFGTGTSVSTPVLSTSGSLSRTFAHNTGGIVGVVIGATVALVLGVLFTLFACRRSSSSQKRKVSGMWISPPLLQGDDGLADAYSPVGRRRSRRMSTGSLRPVSLELPSAADIPPHADADVHYDVDTWAAVPASATSNPPSNTPLSPEYWTSPPVDAGLPNAPLPVFQLPAEQPSPIGAKGFMRRLRHGRPSMASRGLLITLAPVPESPNSPEPSMKEISRPPSSMQGTLLHSSVLNPLPGSTNYSLPWIHRSRGVAAGTAVGWTPPPTWEAPF
ncbi:hypothetical protein DFH09DRAFT_1157428 [Mycena vulgaris]|nr:hypothetical protein DFH09DRAFT_1157428 [Mycena vulgaris]